MKIWRNCRSNTIIYILNGTIPYHQKENNLDKLFNGNPIVYNFYCVYDEHKMIIVKNHFAKWESIGGKDDQAQAWV